jgi:hypothetical protein
MMPRRLRIELLGLQTTCTALFGGVPFKYANTILALIGGGAVLDTEGTASFALGYRIDFPLNGSLRNWELVAGMADPTDLNGQVVPLDYNARNKQHAPGKNGWLLSSHPDL